jgi:Hint domain
MKPFKLWDGSIGNFGAIQPDMLSFPDVMGPPPDLAPSRPGAPAAGIPSDTRADTGTASSALATTTSDSTTPPHTTAATGPETSVTALTVMATSSAEIAPTTESMPIVTSSASVAYAPLVITPIFGSSITDLGSSGATTTAEVEGAINAAIAYYDDNWTSSVPKGSVVGHTTVNTVNVTIAFGFGELGTTGTAVSSLGESEYSLSEIGNGSFQALVNATSGVLPNLPATDPTGGGIFFETKAQLQMLGVTSGSGASAGNIGISSTANFDYNTGNVSVAGAYSAVSVFEHEISEVFGREADLGSVKSSATPTYSILDLYRFSAPNTPALTAGASDYFSLDNGTTALGYFNNQPSNGGDAGDWASSGAHNVVADSYDAFVTAGTAGTISNLDTMVLANIGFQEAPLCFEAGTRILTASGERLIETLAPGDTVPTRIGGTGRVRWIGRRTIDLTRYPAPEAGWPIRIRAEAFAPGQPARDLYLSRDHAVFVDGVLIPVKLLLNGMTIAPEPRRRVSWYHVELDRHDVLLAEGLPAESWLDTGHRDWFANGDGAVTLRPVPDPAPDRASGSAAPFLTEEATVRPVWERLATRARSLGFAAPRSEFTADPALRMRIGAREVRPVLAQGDRHVFMLPHWDGAVRLISRAGHVADSRPWCDDPRRLGVCVGRMLFQDGAGSTDLALDHPALGDGWWRAEREGGSTRRWTNGDAEIAPPAGARLVEIWLAGGIPYRLAEAEPAGATATVHVDPESVGAATAAITAAAA